jgi:hypothetical protein
MMRKPTWIGFKACPLGDVLASKLGKKGSVARDGFASRLRFPY